MQNPLKYAGEPKQFSSARAGANAIEDQDGTIDDAPLEDFDATTDALAPVGAFGVEDSFGDPHMAPLTTDDEPVDTPAFEVPQMDAPDPATLEPEVPELEEPPLDEAELGAPEVEMAEPENAVPEVADVEVPETEIAEPDAAELEDAASSEETPLAENALEEDVVAADVVENTPLDSAEVEGKDSEKTPDYKNDSEGVDMSSTSGALEHFARRLETFTDRFDQMEFSMLSLAPAEGKQDAVEDALADRLSALDAHLAALTGPTPSQPSEVVEALDRLTTGTADLQTHLSEMSARIARLEEAFARDAVEAGASVPASPDPEAGDPLATETLAKLDALSERFAALEQAMTQPAENSAPPPDFEAMLAPLAQQLGQIAAVPPEQTDLAPITEELGALREAWQGIQTPLDTAVQAIATLGQPVDPAEQHEETRVKIVKRIDELTMALADADSFSESQMSALLHEIKGSIEQISLPAQPEPADPAVPDTHVADSLARLEALIVSLSEDQPPAAEPVVAPQGAGGIEKDLMSVMSTLSNANTQLIGLAHAPQGDTAQAQDDFTKKLQDVLSGFLADFKALKEE